MPSGLARLDAQRGERKCHSFVRSSVLSCAKQSRCKYFCELRRPSFSSVVITDHRLIAWELQGCAAIGSRQKPLERPLDDAYSTDGYRQAVSQVLCFLTLLEAQR